MSPIGVANAIAATFSFESRAESQPPGFQRTEDQPALVRSPAPRPTRLRRRITAGAVLLALCLDVLVTAALLVSFARPAAVAAAIAANKIYTSHK